MRSPLALILFGEHPPHPGRPTAAPVPEQPDDGTGPRSQPHARRPRRLRLLALLGAAVALLAACGPGAAPAPAPPSPSEAIIREVFDPIGEGDKAVRVASCESGLNPGAISGGGTYQGLFQLGAHIVAINAYGGNRLDARQNALAARDLRISRGNWSAWPVCGGR